MVRSILAVVLGYFAMAITTIIAVAGLAKAFGLSMDPASQPTALPTGYLIGNILAGIASAVLGGWVCARLAPRAAFSHALILAGLVLVLGLVFAWSESGKGPAPAWYFIAMPAIGTIGTTIGGRLATRASAGQVRDQAFKD